jgi:hypothetical protein
VIKSRKMRWMGRTARTGRGEMHTTFQSKSLKGRDNMHDLSADGRMLLKYIIKE